jgi:hypothetical protein
MLKGTVKRATPTVDPGLLLEFHTETEAIAFYEAAQNSNGEFEMRGTHAVLLKLHPEKKTARPAE